MTWWLTGLGGEILLVLRADGAAWMHRLRLPADRGDVRRTDRSHRSTPSRRLPAIFDRRCPMVQPIPDDRPYVVPYLTVEGAEAAIAWYGRVFAATAQSTMPSADGRLLHAEIEIGDGLVFVADDFPEMSDGRGASPWAVGGSPVTLHLYVADVDETVAAAVAEGATVLVEPTDMFWGDRFAKVQDPFGHLWSLATHVRDVTEEEMAQASADFGTA